MAVGALVTALLTLLITDLYGWGRDQVTEPGEPFTVDVVVEDDGTQGYALPEPLRTGTTPIDPKR
ncbi:hypothetical protein [Streptomyces europaeiscabiei]|uniref:hypothetical protein n=1 Tax=Streptomyces europaeiscabiei TaxID=146819 RepID=UPI002E11F434|nr:hypothetical protein OHB30_00945 [Streptomyces europaeiscabiei]